MNNISLIDKNKCYGCEMCQQICNLNAVKMVDDREGFLYPLVDNNICVECGLCLKFCPANSKTFVGFDHNKSIYSLSLNDDLLLKKSSSGGAAFAIMNYAISQGYYVVGVKYDNDFKGCHYDITNTYDGIELFRGTKYLQAKKQNIFIKIKKILDEKKKVVFFGLPCDVAACRMFLGEKYESIMFVELICHGATSPKVAEQFINHYSKKYGSPIYMTIREKKYGWTPGCIKIIFDNGHIFNTLFDSTEYGYAFRNLSRLSCYNCEYKGDKRLADITIGDFWGASKNDNCWNPNGISVVFAHNEKAEILINKLENVTILDTTYEKAILNNSNINSSRSFGIRDSYSRYFCEKDIFWARKKTENYKSFFIRIIRTIYYSLKFKK